MKICRCCKKLFNPDSKFNRVCPDCKKSNHERRWDTYYGKKGRTR